MSYLCLYLLVSWFVEVIVNLQDLSEVILMLNLYINLYLYLYIVEAEFTFQLCKEYSPLLIPMLYVIPIYINLYLNLYIVEAEFSFQMCKEYIPLIILILSLCLYLYVIPMVYVVPIHCRGGVHLPDA